MEQQQQKFTFLRMLDYMADNKDPNKLTKEQLLSAIGPIYIATRDKVHGKDVFVPDELQESEIRLMYDFIKNQMDETTCYSTLNKTQRRHFANVLHQCMVRMIVLGQLQ